MSWRAVVVALLFALAALGGCSHHAAIPSPIATCAAGTIADAQGACVATACPTGMRADPSAGGACVALGWNDCGAGFIADPSGHGCRDVLPANACAAGTMPVLGSSTCAPVAATACANGFVRDASGWGCAAVLSDAACEEGTMPKLGQTTCVPVGDCSAAFPPSNATLFVDASFTAGQIDATHFATIAAAVDAASDAAVIAVAAGTYSETITPSHTMHIIGRCAAQTIIESPMASSAPGIAIGSAIDVALSGLTLSNHAAAISASGGARVGVSDVVIRGSRGAGMSASGMGTTLTIDRTFVRDTTAASLTDGVGIVTSAGVALTVRDSAIVGSVDTGVFVAGASASITMQRSIVSDTATTANGDFGSALIVRDGASGEISSSVLRKSHEIGFLVYGANTHATVTDVVISDTDNSAGSGYGRGFLVDTGDATLTRVTVRASHDIGVVAEYSAKITASEVVVQGTELGSDGAHGYGVALLDKGTATFTSSAITDNLTGVYASGAGASVEFDDSIVNDTKGYGDTTGGPSIDLENGAHAGVKGSALVTAVGDSFSIVDAGSSGTMDGSVIIGTKVDVTGKHGRAFSVQDGGMVTVTSSAVVANHDIAVSVRGTNAKGSFDRLVVRGTLPQSDGTHGRGIEIGSGGQATITNASIVENRAVGLFVTDAGSTANVQNTWIANTTPDGSPGAPGRAVTAQDAGVITMLGVIAENNVQLGMAAIGPSASLVVTSSLIDATLADADGSFGHGLLVYDEASAILNDVTVQGSAGAGLVFANGSGVVLASRIDKNVIGVNAQSGTTIEESASPPASASDDQLIISSDTTFEGNDTRVGSGELPVPSPLGS